MFGFKNEFPYSDMHQLNLDWILKEMKKVKDMCEGVLDTIKETVESVLDGWKNDGTIDDIVNQNIFHTLDEKITTLSENTIKENSTDYVGMAQLTQEVKESLTGGSTAVVGVNSVSASNIVDTSIPASKIVLSSRSKVILSSNYITIDGYNINIPSFNIIYGDVNQSIDKQTIAFTNIPNTQYISVDSAGDCYCSTSLSTNQTILFTIRIYNEKYIAISGDLKEYVIINGFDAIRGLFTALEPYIDYYNNKLVFPTDLSAVCYSSNITIPCKGEYDILSDGISYLYLNYFTKNIEILNSRVNNIFADYYVMLAIINKDNGIKFSVDFMTINNDGVVVALGDSINANQRVYDAEGVAFNGGFTNIAARKLNLLPRNAAVPGSKYDSIITQLDNESVAQAKFLTVISGVNDFLQSTDITTFETNVKSVFQKIASLNVPHVILTPLHCDNDETANDAGQTLENYVNVIKSNGNTYHLNVIDVFNNPYLDFRNNDALMFDGVHPTYAGHLRIASVVGGYLIY